MGNEKTDGVEGAPCAWEIIRIDSGVDGRVGI